MNYNLPSQDNGIAKAWIVSVETDTIVGARHVTKLYAAMIAEPERALKTVEDGFLRDSRTEIVGALPQWTIARHGLKRGEVRLVCRSFLGDAFGPDRRRFRRQRRHQVARLLWSAPRIGFQ